MGRNRNDYMKKWREDNVDKIRAARAANYANNPYRRETDKRKANEHRQKRLADDPLFFIKARRRTKYGLSVEGVAKILAVQNGRCAICSLELTFEMIKVDHDHTTGGVRGLLCQNCNLGIGHFKDSPERLQSAVKYLRGYDQHAMEMARRGDG